MTLEPRWRALLWGVTALIAAPLALPGWMPFCDLPEHAAAMGSIAHYGDPAYGIAEHYQIGWTTSQYLLLHLVGGGLTKLTADVELTAKILLVTLAVAWVQSSRSLLRAFGGDQRLAVLSALLFWNPSLLLGFLPYLASLPALFWTLAAYVAKPDVEVWSRRTVGLALAAVGVFYTHASAFTLLVAIALAVTTTHLWRKTTDLPLFGRFVEMARRMVTRLAWLTPACVCAGVWVLRGRFGMHGSSIHEADEIGTMAPLRAMKVMALWAHDIWASHVDDAIGISFWGIFLVLLFGGSFRRREDGRPPEERGDVLGSIVPLAVAIAIYLATPFRVGTGLLLNVRMAPVLAVLALLALRPARGLRGTIPILLGAVLAVVQCVDNVQQIRAAQRDVDGLPELLDSVPRGGKLISLNFAGFATNPAHPPFWIYAGSWHRAKAGGIASFSFSELTHWSVQYRPGGGPPKQDDLAWAMNPCLYRNTRDGSFFDYVLVRGALNPFRNDPPGPRWKVRGRTAKYTLWEKDLSRESQTVGADVGPCPELSTPPPYE